MINPLREKQVKQLEALNCADLARKVDELVKRINNMKKFKGVNPLNQHDIKLLDALNLEDTRRKINEIVEFLNKPILSKEQAKNLYIGDCPEPCQLHKNQRIGSVSPKAETKSWEDKIEMVIIDNINYEEFNDDSKDILHPIIEIVKNEKQKIVNDIKEWADKKLKFEVDSGVWGEPGREDALEDLINYLNSI